MQLNNVLVFWSNLSFFFFSCWFVSPYRLASPHMLIIFLVHPESWFCTQPFLQLTHIGLQTLSHIFWWSHQPRALIPNVGSAPTTREQIRKKQTCMLWSCCTQEEQRKTDGVLFCFYSRLKRNYIIQKHTAINSLRNLKEINNTNLKTNHYS